MEKVTLTLREVFATQPALQELESKEWNIRAGRRISVLSKQLVEQLKIIEEGRKSLFASLNVSVDYAKLKDSRKKEVDDAFNDFLENEEVEISIPLMTEDLLGDVKLKGSTYRTLSFFFEEPTEEVAKQPTEDDLEP
jgi:hypothetical protein